MPPALKRPCSGKLEKNGRGDAREVAGSPLKQLSKSSTRVSAAVARPQALVVSIADVDHDIAAVVEEVTADRRAELIARIIAALGDAILGFGEQAGKVALVNEVDDAGDRVRTVKRRAPPVRMSTRSRNWVGIMFRSTMRDPAKPPTTRRPLISTSVRFTPRL